VAGDGERLDPEAYRIGPRLGIRTFSRLQCPVGKWEGAAAGRIPLWSSWGLDGLLMANKRWVKPGESHTKGAIGDAPCSA